MRKSQKNQVQGFVELLHEAHEEIKTNLEKKLINQTLELLVQCQEGAVQLGEFIEKIEGTGFPTVSLLERYCDLVYSIHEDILNNNEDKGNRFYKKLRKALLGIENSIKNDISVRTVAVFLPYKASMWDSLESVWKAADEDPDCDAYVIPIPYYDKKSDGTFSQMHYEGEQYPEYVPITWYKNFDFDACHPDMIFIHNPYDHCNYVTSVEPFFYSYNLKKYTDCLVYIPYYTTAGGMSEAQALCPAYLYADYIVIQSEKYRKYFDASIPDEKFLPFGSPKFDRVINICKNLPEAPEEWKDMMHGRQVYFYNTSINGMLANTENFLKKMEYVFGMFKRREDVCILWRPHPLLETTFDSLRKEYKDKYIEIKNKFIEEEIGILDTTPDIENTIALCDAYIGDGGTSVTSLFGVAGKPIFILNNNIHSLPEEDDWRGEIIRGVYPYGQNQWYVTQGNKLFYSKNNDFHYEFFCDLSCYSGGNYYQRAIEFEDKVYICPGNAQDILIVSKDKTIEKIKLQNFVEQHGVFYTSLQVGCKIFILPNRYPAVVCFDMRTHEVNYLSGINDIYMNQISGERRFGGVCVWNNSLCIGSPNGSKVLRICADTLKITEYNIELEGGILGIVAEKNVLWITPYEGSTLCCLNLKTGSVKKYNVGLEGFQCIQRPQGYECSIRPFSIPIFYNTKIILPPLWGNKFISIDQETEEIEEWKFPIQINSKGKNGYFLSLSTGYFAYKVKDSIFRYYYNSERKIYDVDIITEEVKEVTISFNKEELKCHEPGFMETSQWMQYSCYENSFNSLKDFLDNNITGNQFEAQKQIDSFSQINMSINGDCGEKVYQFILEKV